MKKLFFFICILTSINIFSQLEFHKKPYIKGSIELKNGKTLNGFIKLKNSAFDVRFKESKKDKKSIKIKFKEIIEMTTVEDSLRPRKFYYKITDKSKFLSFVELIHKGNIDIYINASIDLDLFYSNIKEFYPTEEWMNDFKNQSLFNNINHELLFNKYLPFHNNLNFWVGIKVSKTDYFLFKKGNENLIHIGSKGNFLYKNFKKTASKYFSDCPVLIEKLKSKKLKLKHLTEILEFYENNCSK